MGWSRRLRTHCSLPGAMMKRECGYARGKEHRVVNELDIDDDRDVDEDDHETVAQRLLWSDTLPPSSSLLSSSDVFLDGLDFDFGHVDSCTPELTRESPAQQQPTIGLVDDVDGSKDTPNANLDPDAKEMASFWSYIEAHLASSSDSTATATEGTGAIEGEGGFAQLWG
jgi:hypothetical protein